VDRKPPEGKGWDREEFLLKLKIRLSTDATFGRLLPMMRHVQSRKTGRLSDGGLCGKAEW
jgi:hypothetical protein